MPFVVAFALALTLTASARSPATPVRIVTPSIGTDPTSDPGDSPDPEPGNPGSDSAFVRFAKSPGGIVVFTIGGLLVIAVIVAVVICSAKPDAAPLEHAWQDAKRYTVDGLI
jgi:hypothetical protein